MKRVKYEGDKYEIMMDNKVNKAIDELTNTMKKPIEELNKIQEIQLNFVVNNVKNIINSNTKNEQEIQKTLDMLLDLTYCYGDEIKEIYYDLLKYYEKINLDVSKEYEKFYLEIVNEEENL